jgi:hypothetical protein
MQAANQPTRNSKVAENVENESQWIQSTQVTVTTLTATCPPVGINDVQLPDEDVKYLGLHLNRKLTWHKHIVTKLEQLGITLTKMYWLLGHKSKLYQ